MQEPIDEVLFSSIIEACIRIKRLDSLSDFIGRYKVKGLFKTLRPFIVLKRSSRGCVGVGEGVGGLGGGVEGGFMPRNISAPIYGAMIKAFGEAGYLHQVRELWAQLPLGLEMPQGVVGTAASQVTSLCLSVPLLRQSHNVKPTAITIGCVVEALVINKQGEEAWQLVQDLASSFHHIAKLTAS